jgi:hypothetical protein
MLYSSHLKVSAKHYIHLLWNIAGIQQIQQIPRDKQCNHGLYFQE